MAGECDRHSLYINVTSYLSRLEARCKVYYYGSLLLDHFEQKHPLEAHFEDVCHLVESCLVRQTSLQKSQKVIFFTTDTHYKSYNLGIVQYSVQIYKSEQHSD